eukprot:7641370-Ditylum_brightwellii.AAC.1
MPTAQLQRLSCDLESLLPPRALVCMGSLGPSQKHRQMLSVWSGPGRAAVTRVSRKSTLRSSADRRAQNQ